MSRLLHKESRYVLLLDTFMDERLYPCTCREQTGGLYTISIGRYEGSERYLAWGHAGEWVGHENCFKCERHMKKEREKIKSKGQYSKQDHRVCVVLCNADLGSWDQRGWEIRVWVVLFSLLKEGKKK